MMMVMDKIMRIIEMVKMLLVNGDLEEDENMRKREEKCSDEQMSIYDKHTAVVERRSQCVYLERDS